jgi:hypothetical protein
MIASLARPRAHRLFTVPSATPSTAAVSATENPSRSTSVMAARCSTGSCAIAFSTTIDMSRSASRSRRSAGSPGPVSGNATVGRACRRRIRSRQALTTIRCSQVVTADSARNDPAARYAEISASCRASAASSGSRSVRRATAQSRSLCRRTRVSKAYRSPPAWARISSASPRSGSVTNGEYPPAGAGRRGAVGGLAWSGGSLVAPPVSGRTGPRPGRRRTGHRRPGPAW